LLVFPPEIIGSCSEVRKSFVWKQVTQFFEEKQKNHPPSICICLHRWLNVRTLDIKDFRARARVIFVFSISKIEISGYIYIYKHYKRPLNPEGPSLWSHEAYFCWLHSFVNENYLEDVGKNRKIRSPWGGSGGFGTSPNISRESTAIHIAS